jgi:hypothetical protein
VGIIIQTILGFLLGNPSIPPGTRGAPGPEIGDGLVGVTIATVAVLAFVIYPRLKRWRLSKSN